MAQGESIGEDGGQGLSEAVTDILPDFHLSAPRSLSTQTITHLSAG
jgi:hypothetical protein